MLTEGRAEPLTVKEIDVSDLAGSGGGGIFNTSDGMLTLSDCTVSGNLASGGGGIYNDGGTLGMTFSMFDVPR